MIPQDVHEELAVGSIIRAREPLRSRTVSVSTDNSGFLTSSTSSSPLTQSPVSRVSGLPDTGNPNAVSFSGLPHSPDSDSPWLTVEHPKSSGTTLRLTAPLGVGAFSSVWLAEDLSDDPLVLRSRRSLRNLRRETSMSSMSLSRASSLQKVRVPGVRPLGAGKRMLAEQQQQRTGSINASASPTNSALPATRLVALKMTARSSFAQPCSGREEALQRDRTRVSFVREVEVLRHIMHPNITALLTHLTTPSYHVLVLPYLPGGDLLGLVNNDNAHGALTETLLRRIWSELCKAVGWMHGVGLVHRDVKLENILLTTPFPFPAGTTAPAGPLIKLTDFGLSRFIDTAAPLLSTRCGSEAYAAPELVISGRRYDARETDAWACGVVLYALCARRLPFGEGATHTGAGHIGREGGAREGAVARRHWLMCIARGEYEWPAPAEEEDTASHDGRPALETAYSGDSERTLELAGPRLVESEGARGIVARLLVRDPARRAKISELWDDPWMGGANASAHAASARLLRAYGFEDEDLEGEEEDVEDDGLLLDQDGIDSIARQEVQ
ncbi:kinase-like protein [Mycena vitilis]|nr:kinase-like protein [Mycena vitilis]